MQVRVLFFGVLRDRFGCGEEPLDVGEQATVADVLNVYKERLPGFMWGAIAVAVNQAYARSETRLTAGDEIALLPPVSGGCEGQERNAG